MLLHAFFWLWLALLSPSAVLARQHGPDRLDARRSHHEKRAASSAGQLIARGRTGSKRSLNDVSLSDGMLRVPLKRAPVSTSHPRVRFLAHQAHASVRHARAVGVPLNTEALRKRAEAVGRTLDLDALRKRAMPVGMGGHHRVAPLNQETVKGDGRKKGGKPTDDVSVSAAAAVANTSSSTSSGSGFSPAVAKADQDNSVTDAESPTAKNSIGLNIEAADVGYFGSISLGTPAKSFQILLDSGSADFWVPSQVCTTCGSHQTLGSKSSSTFVASDQGFTVTYGTGEVEGVLVQDTVGIAGLTLKNHQFGVTTAESSDFSSKDTPFDGIMGLGLSILSEEGVKTPIESLAAAGLVGSAQMGYNLGRVGGSNDGEATFGGVDSSKFSGSLTLLDNTSQKGFWQADVSAVTVNGKSIGGKTARSAIIDTGTTLVVAPPDDAAAVHALIPGAASDGQGGFTLPCTTTASVSLTLGGKSFSIAAQDLAFLPVNLNDLSGTCQSGIASGEVGTANTWLLGDVFLRNNYFATDVDNNQIGLAPQA